MRRRGVTSPDLTQVGRRSSLAHLESSILRPSEDVRPENWWLEAAGKDGVQFAGKRLNEDTFSVQILTAKDGLLSLDKAALREYLVVKTSTMPAYAERLSESQVADLVAYLASLQ